VTFAMQHGRQGDMFVRKAAAATVRDLAQALLNVFGAKNELQVLGIRAGEKMHEVLITAEEFVRAEEFEDYYRIASRHGHNYDEFFTRGMYQSAFARDGYTSENAPRLTVPVIEELLLHLPEIQRELAAVSPARSVPWRAA
jgi:UDP-N-acetylglucosamine 4,6-dehydratase